MLETLASPGLPPGLSAMAAILLVGLSCFTSLLTAAVGIGGGVMMLAALASLTPPAVALPVHGVVQIGSNFGRALLLYGHIRWALLRWFTLGSLVGVSAGGLFFVVLPVAVLQMLLAGFILYSVWAPRLKPSAIADPGFVLVGMVGTFCTMFVGATGPLLAAFLSPDRLPRHNVVATHAACMSLQHGFKVIAFGVLGFSYLDWLPLLIAMLASGFVGTLVGRQVLNKIPERFFSWGFKLVLTLLALRLLWSALAVWAA